MEHITSSFHFVRIWRPLVPLVTNDECEHYAAGLLELEVPVVLARDYNVIPTDLDVCKPQRWVDDA